MGLFAAADRHPFEFRSDEAPEGPPEASRLQARVKELRRHGSAAGRRVRRREPAYARHGEPAR
ncbi:MAG: hypothetical protein KGJ86_04560 [Chloroflexota bacterium]|nr:hypothetical protein [Chloroflexota bacterium]